MYTYSHLQQSQFVKSTLLDLIQQGSRPEKSPGAESFDLFLEKAVRARESFTQSVSDREKPTQATRSETQSVRKSGNEVRNPDRERSEPVHTGEGNRNSEAARAENTPHGDDSAEVKVQSSLEASLVYEQSLENLPGPAIQDLEATPAARFLEENELPVIQLDPGPVEEVFLPTAVSQRPEVGMVTENQPEEGELLKDHEEIMSILDRLIAMTREEETPASENLEAIFRQVEATVNQMNGKVDVDRVSENEASAEDLAASQDAMQLEEGNRDFTEEQLSQSREGDVERKGQDDPARLTVQQNKKDFEPERETETATPMKEEKSVDRTLDSKGPERARTEESAIPVEKFEMKFKEFAFKTEIETDPELKVDTHAAVEKTASEEALRGLQRKEKEIASPTEAGRKSGEKTVEAPGIDKPRAAMERKGDVPGRILTTGETLPNSESQRADEAFEGTIERGREMKERFIKAENLERQLFNEIVKKASFQKFVDGRNVLSVQLKPELLGQVRIEVTSTRGEMAARFIVDREETREAIQETQGDLVNRLASMGIHLTDLDVDVQSQQGGNSQSGKGREDSRNHGDGSDQAFASLLDPEKQNAERTPGNQTELDVYI